MATTMKPRKTSKQNATAKLLTQWRQEAGYRLDEAAVFTSQHMTPGQSVSRETIRRYEHSGTKDGTAVEGMSPFVLVAFLLTYDKRISDLTPEAREVVERAREVLIAATCWFRVDAGPTAA